MNGIDGPSMVWGIVALVMLLASLGARRLPMGQMAKMLLGWIAIFALLFVLFSFRHDFATVWKRVKAEVSGTSGQTVSGSAIVLNRQDDGHYWLSATVNGKQISFLIDSGASYTSMSTADAKTVGVDIDANGFPVVISTANGEVSARRAVAKSLRVGEFEIKDHKMVVSDSFGETSVLGMNFLEKLNSWKVEGNVMTLQP